MQRVFSRLRHHQEGIALVEFALVLPLMILLVFGGIEVARYIIILQKVQKASYMLTDVVAQYTPAQSNTPASGELSVNVLQNQILPQMHRMMGLYGDEESEGVIINSIVHRQGKFLLAWRYGKMGQNLIDAGETTTVTNYQPDAAGGGGINTTVSSDGYSGVYNYQANGWFFNYATRCPILSMNADVTTNLVNMIEGENMIVGEMYFYYKPIASFLVRIKPAGGTGDGFSMRPHTITRRIWMHPRNGDLLVLPPAHPWIDSTTYPNVTVCRPE